MCYLYQYIIQNEKIFLKIRSLLPTYHICMPCFNSISTAFIILNHQKMTVVKIFTRRKYFGRGPLYYICICIYTILYNLYL